MRSSFGESQIFKEDWKIIQRDGQNNCYLKMALTLHDEYSNVIGAYSEREQNGHWWELGRGAMLVP